MEKKPSTKLGVGGLSRRWDEKLKAQKRRSTEGKIYELIYVVNMHNHSGSTARNIAKK